MGDGTGTAIRLGLVLTWRYKEEGRMYKPILVLKAIRLVLTWYARGGSRVQCMCVYTVCAQCVYVQCVWCICEQWVGVYSSIQHVCVCVCVRCSPWPRPRSYRRWHKEGGRRKEKGGRRKEVYINLYIVLTIVGTVRRQANL